MSTANQFVESLHTWVGLFMTRSMRDMEHFARQNGLTMAHFSLLMRLHYHQCFMVSDISDHLGVTNAAASQMVQRLFEQGLITRTEDLNDRRVKQISLSPTGKALVEQVVTIRRQWMESLDGQINSSERDAIILGLTHLIEAARRLEGTQPESNHLK
jgi:DNA-binding MarR family transcriptional regulator